VKKLLYTFNARCVDGLQESLLTLFVNFEMIRRKNFLEDKKSFEPKKNKNIKKKLKGACTLKRIRTLRFYTMN
jgi:hypothetical protein